MHKRVHGKDLCCAYLPEVIEDYRADLRDKQIPGPVTPAARLSEAESAMFSKMKTEIQTFFVDQRNVPLETDTITEAFFKELESGSSKSVAAVAKDTYGLKDSEVKALKNWVSIYEIDTAEMQGALAQMNPVSGHTFRTTHLRPKQIDMLVNFKPGIKSGGEPGVYSIEGEHPHFPSAFLLC